MRPFWSGVLLAIFCADHAIGQPCTINLVPDPVTSGKGGWNGPHFELKPLQANTYELLGAGDLVCSGGSSFAPLQGGCDPPPPELLDLTTTFEFEGEGVCQIHANLHPTNATGFPIEMFRAEFMDFPGGIPGPPIIPPGLPDFVLPGQAVALATLGARTMVINFRLPPGGPLHHVGLTLSGQVVPEPTSIFLLIGGMAIVTRRRRA